MVAHRRIFQHSRGPKKIGKPRQQGLPRGRFPIRTPIFRNDVATEFDERHRIYLHEFSGELAHALEAQREVLTHEATEEIRRRDSISMGRMRIRERGSLSVASAQREGFEQTRSYLQKRLNFSQLKKIRKYHHLYQEFQHERASLVLYVLTLAFSRKAQ